MPGDDGPVDRLVDALRGLRIWGTGNHVHITIVAAAGEVAAQPAPKAKAKAASSHGGRRFYVIVECRRRPDLVGVWHASWSELCVQLPGGQLFGSTARPCKGFDSLEEAQRLWGQLRPGVVAKIHEC